MAKNQRGPSSTSIRSSAPITISSDSPDFWHLKGSNPGMYRIALNVGSTSYLSSNQITLDANPDFPPDTSANIIGEGAPNLEDISIVTNETYVDQTDGVTKAKVVFKIQNPDKANIVGVNFAKSKQWLLANINFLKMAKK